MEPLWRQGAPGAPGAPGRNADPLDENKGRRRRLGRREGGKGKEVGEGKDELEKEEKVHSLIYKGSGRLELECRNEPQ